MVLGRCKDEMVGGRGRPGPVGLRGRVSWESGVCSVPGQLWSLWWGIVAQRPAHVQGTFLFTDKKCPDYTCPSEYLWAQGLGLREGEATAGRGWQPHECPVGKSLLTATPPTGSHLLVRG